MLRLSGAHRAATDSRTRRNVCVLLGPFPGIKAKAQDCHLRGEETADAEGTPARVRDSQRAYVSV
jgi:hypothetical protein